jgi:hypothetical protein
LRFEPLFIDCTTADIVATTEVVESFVEGTHMAAASTTKQSYSIIAAAVIARITTVVG